MLSQIVSKPSSSIRCLYIRSPKVLVIGCKMIDCFGLMNQILAGNTIEARKLTDQGSYIWLNCRGTREEECWRKRVTIYWLCVFRSL